MQVDLRLVTADDWELFRSIRLRALADAPDAFGRTLAEALEQPPSQWRDLVAGPGPRLVVLEDGVPVAMGGVFAPEDEPGAMVWGMWTAPEARGRGHGARVLRELVAWCREQGRHDVLLHVTEGNDAARRLYLAHGFAPTGTWEELRPGSSLRIEELRLGAGEDASGRRAARSAGELGADTGDRGAEAGDGVDEERLQGDLRGAE